MSTFVTICILLLVAGIALTYIVCQQAPEGHEDHRGFSEDSEES